MRAALISNGLVVNAIIVGPSYTPPSGMTLVPSETAGIGDAYANGVFTRPPPSDPIILPPASISRRQCAREMFERGLITGPEMVAMTATGTPPAMIEAMILMLPEADQWVARADFAAGTYERGNAMLTVFTAQHVLTENPAATPEDVEAEIDAFFLAANAH
ncbi:MAG: hypothetical protein HC909_01425 [Blastochloris sp.]|nr:hypothetical protein [Blastochloris sp.]